MNLRAPATIFFFNQGFTRYSRGTPQPFAPVLQTISDFGTMSMLDRSGFSFFVCLAFLLLLVPAILPAASAPTTDTTTTTTTTPDRAGGSIYFETYPPGGTIWLDNVEIGTSPLTYYSEKTGTLDVSIRKKGFEDYAGTVTVKDGERVTFAADLTLLSGDITAKKTETMIAEPVTTAPAIRKSTMNIPTPWPTPSPESPVDPAVVIGAAAIGIGISVIRRR